MLSIDNTYSADEVRAWVDPALGRGSRPTHPTAGDGGCSQRRTPRVRLRAQDRRGRPLAAVRDGTLARALTRGDGQKGDDVTHAARTIRADPAVLDDSRRADPAVLEIRGEVFIPRPEFERINAERRIANGLEPFMNPRNACAGTIKQLDPARSRRTPPRFIAHGRGETSPTGFAFAAGTRRSAKIAAIGVPTSPTRRRLRKRRRDHARDRGIRPSAHARLRHRRHGRARRFVRRQQDALGTTARARGGRSRTSSPPSASPRRSLAVEHQVGKTGKITPRAVMEPVLLAGTTVRHASLHNFGLIAQEGHPRRGHGAGREGRRDHPLRRRARAGRAPEGRADRSAPRRLPRLRGAGRDRDRDGTVSSAPDEAASTPRETARRCVNPECPAQLREKLVWFVGRNQMDIDGLGEQTIDQILATASPPAPQRRRRLVRRS
jgi:DNA ligase (NAD+)